jgi:hypothetical protein
LQPEHVGHPLKFHRHLTSADRARAALDCLAGVANRLWALHKNGTTACPKNTNPSSRFSCNMLVKRRTDRVIAFGMSAECGWKCPFLIRPGRAKMKTPRSRATSLARATVDVPARFRNSKSVGAVFGLTPSKYQSGEINRTGSISRCGDEMMRVMLYEAAQSMLQYCSRM